MSPYCLFVSNSGNKQCTMPMIIKKTMTNNALCIVQDLHTLPKLFKVTLWLKLFQLISSLDSSTNLTHSTFLHLQFL